MPKTKPSIKKQYNEAINYIKETKYHILAVIIIFFGSALISFFNPDKFSFLDAFLKELVNKAAGLNLIEMLLFILQNNLQSALVGFLLGIFLGIMPLSFALFNGLVIGYVLAIASEVQGPSVILRLIPHGIFELPAIFIALALGLKLGLFLFSKNAYNELKRRAYKGFIVFLTIIIPLLIIAAIIESILISLIR